MKNITSLIYLMGFLSLPANAGTGAIFPDGDHLVRADEKSLKVYSLEDKTEIDLQFPPEFGYGDPVFDKNGNLYFTVGGDLWKGSIAAGEDKEVPFILNGARIWPLAFRETDEGNSSGLSAKQIIPMEKWIVLELSRAGGSGWGKIIRVPNADAYEKHLTLKWDELEDCGSGSDAAVSADGKRAFIFIHGAGRWFEVENGTADLKPLPSAN